MKRANRKLARAVLAGLLLLIINATSAPARAQTSAPPAQKAAADMPQEVVLEGRRVAHKVRTRADDICAQCYQRVEQNDVVYVVDGQRVALHTQEAEAHLSGQLLRLVAQLQPRGAFLGAGKQAALSKLWFFAGLYVLLGLICGAFAAHRALHRGYSAAAWFTVGFFLTIPGIAYLLTRPAIAVRAPAGVPAGLRKISSTYEPQLCVCGAENHPSARACSTCGKKLEPKIESEAQRALHR